MRPRPALLAPLALALAAFTPPARPAPAADALVTAFTHPPAAAKPWVYWYFMDGHLTRAGMSADLAAMQHAGIGGAIFLEVNLGLPRGPVDFMSPAWQDLLGAAIHEADQRGLQLALGSGPGWCGTGGPWVPPALAMQDLVGRATRVTGPTHFRGPLPRARPRPPYFGMGTLTPALKAEWENFYRDVAVLAYPTPPPGSRIADLDEKALYVREPFSSKPGVKPFLPEPAVAAADDGPAGAGIPLGRIIDLTPRLSADGRLDWDVPPGHWTILRLGRTLTGQTTRPAPQPGLGFETDKFNRAALDAHFRAYEDKLLARAGPRDPRGGVTMLHFDSWEMGAQNWTGRFRAEFAHRRGYDPLKYLPAYTGAVVVSPEISERFLWDVRQTAQELVVENHVGHLRDLAHEHGLTFSLEPYDLNPCADLTLGRVADVPQGEFWHLGYDTTYSVIEAASIAHTNGRPMVAAEAFTSNPGEDWKADPAALKRQGDWAFCAGVNRFDFHRMQAQPRLDQFPGMTMWKYGVHWDRTQTWWDMVPAYHAYLARCQALLQRGVTVADVCFLAGEGAPHVFRPPASATTGHWPDHTGYAFDGCAPETLLERAEVRDGALVFPGGTTYRILVLPEARSMTPRLLRKVAALVAAGATVFGPPPERSPSLQDYPACDAEVRRLAAAVWGDCDGRTVFEHRYGRGRVLWRRTTVKPGEEYGDYAAVTAVLAQMNLPPDFSADGPLRYTHRRDGDADLYFVANKEEAPVTATASFRVTGKAPELFDPLTGEIRPLPQYAVAAGLTRVPLRFEPAQSFFVVFRAPAGPAGAGPNFPILHRTATLTGPWTVHFDPKWGGPADITFPTLEDWSRRPEDGIRHYSGTAVYEKNFPSDAPPAGRLYLDLGTVDNLARVTLNGRDLGVVWCAPRRVEVTGILHAGTNRLVVTVANLWPNRLIGDLSRPPGQRLAQVALNPFTADSPLLPSGLLGPVELLATEPGPR